nr:pollen-specific leucine-rich repeat extensin-like protein 1 [Ipomoea batatas]
MEEDDGESGTPFWVQGNTGGRRGDGVRCRVESAVFSSGILVFLLVVAAVFFMVFVLPSMASFTNGLFRPSSVKKSRDSVNVVLVFLAIVFEVLSRSKNELEKSNPGTPVWYGYRDEGNVFTIIFHTAKRNEGQKWRSLTRIGNPFAKMPIAVVFIDTLLKYASLDIGEPQLRKEVDELLEGSPSRDGSLFSVLVVSTTTTGLLIAAFLAFSFSKADCHSSFTSFVSEKLTMNAETLQSRPLVSSNSMLPAWTAMFHHTLPTFQI